MRDKLIATLMILLFTSSPLIAKDRKIASRWYYYECNFKRESSYKTTNDDFEDTLAMAVSLKKDKSVETSVNKRWLTAKIKLDGTDQISMKVSEWEIYKKEIEIKKKIVKGQKISLQLKKEVSEDKSISYSLECE